MLPFSYFCRLQDALPVTTNFIILYIVIFAGQLHEKSPEVIGDDPDNPPVNGWRKYFDNSKRLIGLMVPVCITLILWFALVIRNNYWHHFNESWYMTVTMVFGSLIAGQFIPPIRAKLTFINVRNIG